MRLLPKRSLTALLVALALMSTACKELTDLPTLSDKDLEKIQLAESSRIYAGNGALITTLHGVENRTIVPLSKIPDDLINAVIAIEDERYWEHHGVDVRAIMRALVANITSGGVAEGGSTITQQYIKNAIIAP
jgi:penicillin-binding protein 1A